VINIHFEIFEFNANKRIKGSIQVLREDVGESKSTKIE